jgi:hypothetical protein
MSWLNWIGLAVGVVGIFATARRSVGAALVFFSLALVSIWAGAWDDNMTATRWVIFWISFVLTLAITLIGSRRMTGLGDRVMVYRRRHTGLGLFQLLLTIALASGWDFGDLAGWGGILPVLLVALIVAFVLGAGRIVLGVIAAAVIVALLFGWALPNLINGIGPAMVRPSGTETTTAGTTQPGSSSTLTPEEQEYVIDMPERDGNRLNKDGAPAGSEPFRVAIANQAKHDPLTLYVYYMHSPYGKTKALKNEAVIAKGGKIQDGNVYSAEGIAAYKRWIAVWMDHDLTEITSVKEITFQKVNTGVSNNRVTQDPSGVRGKDKSGVDITYRDATSKVVARHSALYRCSQPTGGGGQIPNVPKGPTDNPPTSTPTPSASTTPPTGGKRISDHTADPGVQADPAPAPTRSASSPGGYTTPTPAATSTPSPTATPVVVDPQPSNTPVATPTW